MSLFGDVRVLFVGLGGLDGVTHYRSLLPSQALGCDLIVQDSSGVVVYTSEGCLDVHDVVVFQMPVFEWQFREMLELRSRGVVVLVNVDDYLPAVPKLFRRGVHQHGNVFDREIQDCHKRCLALADGILCSTPWLVRKLSRFGRTVLCRNGLDLSRYDVVKPEGDAGVVVGWAGGTGHVGAFSGIAGAVRDVLREFDDVVFACLGDDFTGLVDVDGSLRGRCFSLPWQDLLLYPRDMAVFDVGLAPSESNDFFRAKSQLRFYELGALGVASVVSPMYDECVDGVSGLVVESPLEWCEAIGGLVCDPVLRAGLGGAARDYVWGECGIGVRCLEWRDAILSFVGGGV